MVAVDLLQTADPLQGGLAVVQTGSRWVVLVLVLAALTPAPATADPITIMARTVQVDVRTRTRGPTVHARERVRLGAKRTGS